MVRASGATAPAGRVGRLLVAAIAVVLLVGCGASATPEAASDVPVDHGTVDGTAPREDPPDEPRDDPPVVAVDDDTSALRDDEHEQATAPADEGAAAAPTDDDPDPGPLAGRVVGLDPGHNGGNVAAPDEIARPVDAGGFTKPCNTTGTATADGYRESTFNLEVAEALRERLEALGAEVHLTREDDEGVGPCIDVRGTFGQATGADLVVSIHADGAAAGARGFHVIVPVARDGTDPAIVAPSAALGEAVRDALVAAGLRPATYVGTDGLVARGDLATLNLSTVPVVLLEAGNLGDPDDAAELRDPDWQARLADALAAAIVDHLGAR